MSESPPRAEPGVPGSRKLTPPGVCGPPPGVLPGPPGVPGPMLAPPGVPGPPGAFAQVSPAPPG
eukprot:CAMPEP_0182545826 /NCGR_PEP_ID=MMETSP1323-20130603/35080_1 /TAXON_ID=236787 /ORGANISM="Florenciella parvula, Strain RCC1693" /LENGTH=63 /DNA_ID=CAMNT_0024756999 /DNA_START=57 /DNA_END=244 /DNA_ORIENTATION=-